MCYLLYKTSEKCWSGALLNAFWQSSHTVHRLDKIHVSRQLTSPATTYLKPCDVLQQYTIIFLSQLDITQSNLRVFASILSSSGVTVHGRPSPERSTRKHVWELHHPKGSVVSSVTRRDPGPGCQSGVEEHKCRERRERLAAASGLRLQLRSITKDGQISAEVRNYLS